MRDIVLDIRYALRALRATPGATLSAVATLALAVGMTTSIFSVVSGIVLRPLPFPHESRLVTLCEQYPGATSDWCSIATPNSEDIGDRSRTIESIGYGRSWPYHMETSGAVESVRGGLASAGLFPTLGVRAQRGRLIEPADLTGRPSTVAVLTDEMWRARFGAREDIIGYVVSIDKEPVTIVGVLEPGFELPRIGKVDLWRPLHVNPRDERNRDWRGFVSFARLREGVSIEAARRELAELSRQLKAERFATTDGWGLTLITTRDLVIGRVRPMLLLFLASVVGVLLIACANVANLLLARSAARVRETAVRVALGASRGRLVRGLLLESLLLATAGGALGLSLAAVATRWFKSIAPSGLPRIDEVSIDARVLLFALGLALATAVVFGLVPALRAARVDLSHSLRESGRGMAARRGRLSAMLVTAELALAVTLVAGAGLLTRSFGVLTSWRPGFEQQHLLTFTVFAPSSKYPTGAAVASLWRGLEAEIGAIPGVVSVGTASAGPLFGGRETWEMDIAQPAALSRASVRWFDMSPGLFATLGVPIVRGRALGEADVLDGPLAGVVNETLARRFWPEQDAIGKTLTFARGTDRATFHVVGVVRDVPSLRPDEPLEPELYWSNRQLPRPFTFFVVRTTVPPSSVAAAIRSRTQSVDRDLEANGIRSYADNMNEALTTPRFSMLLVFIFGVAALVFAGIGTYGLLSYLVSQRTREIGIRLALGAQRQQILTAILRSGLTLAGLGVAVGLILTLAIGRLTRTLVVGVSASDPASLGMAAMTLLAVAAAACFVPAWRASRVDPVTALNEE